MKTATTVTTPTLALIDPWEGLPPTYTDKPGDPSAAPLGWSLLLPAHAQRLGAALLHVLMVRVPDATLNDLPRVVAEVKRTIRARWAPLAELAESATVVESLRGYLVEDRTERRVWRALDDVVNGAGEPGTVFLTERAARTLIQAGDLLQTLRSRRAALDEQIARLEKYFAATPANGTAAK